MAGVAQKHGEVTKTVFVAVIVLLHRVSADEKQLHLRRCRRRWIKQISTKTNELHKSGLIGEFLWREEKEEFDT